MSQYESTTILDSQGRPMVIGKIIPSDEPTEVPFAHDPDHPTENDFQRYALWRQTKCKPRSFSNIAERTEDCDQATHEFVGEVAELADLVVRTPRELLILPASREKLLDEIGDIYFTASWVGDTWGFNVLALDTTPPPDEILPEHRRKFARNIVARLQDPDITVPEADEIVNRLAYLTLQMSANAGLLANSFKKARWQQRPQSIEIQGARVANVLLLAAEILAMAGYQVSEALRRNIEKLDARYPEGYQPGPGSGIRTGKGA